MLILKRVFISVISLYFYAYALNTAQTTTLNIIHMNDIHSHLDSEHLELNFNGSVFRFDSGGYPLAGTTINYLKSKQKNTLLLNAGDALQGTLYYTLFNGDADAKMMNLVKWDAFVLGNHEFDNGDNGLASFIHKLNIPIISSNIHAPKDDPLSKLWTPYIIRDFDGEKVGIIGISTVKETRDSSSPGKNIKFFDAFNTVQKQIEILNSKGINKIIVLSHLGYESDKRLAQTIEGIDVIVGGHSHTILGEFDRFGLNTEGKYPTIKHSKKDEKVCIVQAGSYAKMVGNLKVIFDKDGVVLSCEGTPVIPLGQNVAYKDAKGNFKDLNSSLKTFVQQQIDSSPLLYSAKPDAELELELKYYKKQVSVKKLNIIGYADENMNHIRIPGRNYGSKGGSTNPLGSDVAPVVAKAYYERIKTSDIVILNAGGVRTSIEKGKISIDTVYNLLPFSNTLVTFSMKGSLIHKLLEETIEHIGSDYSGSGSFPYAYAMRYDINMSASKGNRVSNIDVLDKNTKKYLALDNNRTYLLSTIDYLAEGKDGYNLLKTLQSTNTYFDYANSFVVYINGLQNDNKNLSKVSAENHCIKKFNR